MAVARSKFTSLASKFITDTFSAFTKSIDIKKTLLVDDGQGGQSEESIVFSTVNCIVEDQSNKESNDDGRIDSMKHKKFMFEYVAGLNESMTINDGSNNYDILEINNIQGVWIEIIAKRKAENTWLS